MKLYLQLAVGDFENLLQQEPLSGPHHYHYRETFGSNWKGYSEVD